MSTFLIQDTRREFHMKTWQLLIIFELAQNMTLHLPWRPDPRGHIYENLLIKRLIDKGENIKYSR